jgi:uncharacterized membrane protein YqaE (UPF0057 family)
MGDGWVGRSRLISLVCDLLPAERVFFFAVFFPPIAVGMERGCGCDLLINILLTLLAFIPGIIHAFWIVLQNDSNA